MTEAFTYRISREDDIPRLIRLWNRNSGWGSLAPADCRREYVDTPYGPSITPVAVDADGEIAGQIKFVPCLVVVEGRTYKALKMHAMILRKDIRSPWTLTRDHPLVRLYNIGIEAAIARGYSIVCSQPAYAWRLFFRWLGTFSGSEYQCFTLPLSGKGAARRHGCGHVISRIASDFGLEYMELWKTAEASLPITCGLLREPAWLRQKVDAGGLFTVEVREKENGSLVGYCSVEHGAGLIDDVLARSSHELPQVIDATRRLLQSDPGLRSARHVKELRAMQTPFLQGALNSLGFKPVDFKFAFVCTSIDPSLPLDRISAEKWYVMPGG